MSNITLDDIAEVATATVTTAIKCKLLQEKDQIIKELFHKAKGFGAEFDNIVEDDCIIKALKDQARIYDLSTAEFSSTFRDIQDRRYELWLIYRKKGKT